MAEIRIKTDFSMADVEKQIAGCMETAKDRTVEVLKGLADKMAEDLRANALFFNHTHNLRSSLGAVVFRDGQIVHRNFRFSDGSGATAGGGLEGIGKGGRVAEGNIPPSGIGMMLVAGEDYALYVEAKSNKWVLSGTAGELKKTIGEML